MDLLDAPLAHTEFLVVDTETNGKAGDACELTEVGAVLVGGGELHDRWESLVGVRAPLSRGIQRFTGITQAMVDEAPAAELVLPDLADQLRDRVLVGHNIAFDRRVLRQAFERSALEWPDPPALCTVALARRFAPLARQRKLAALAGSLGIDVEVSHRALADAETTARVFCALFPRLCANASTVREALAVLRPSRRRSAPKPDLGRRRLLERPEFADLPDTPGVYIFRNAEGQVLYVGKSVNLRSRARSHFAPSAPTGDWTAQASIVDHRATRSELGALLLESRLI
ncbi:MAG TPA: exonuclease domain-containing protein, partial [Capillimicrobium sp.]|nr:exonuclease domain-containing protein [Capillimicrobium sp.]